MPITKPRLSTNINTDVGTFTDPILVLHQGSTAADVDVGFLMNRSNGLTSNAAVIWQESSKSFVHILTNSSGAADANLVVQSYANVSVGNVLLINNAGIYVDGTLGSAGQVLASDGSKTFWAAPGGFTGGTVPNPTVFQSNLVVSNTTTSTNTTTGALVVLGGAGIAGNVYTNALYTATGVYWSGNGQAFTSTTIANTAEITANLSSGQNVGLSLTATGVAAGNYGSATSIPTIVVDSKGRITSVTSNVVSTTINLTGDSGTGSVAGGGTLTVNGTSNQINTSVTSSTITVSLAGNLVTPGNLTVTGNLNVLGNTITIGSNNLTVVDSIIDLHTFANLQPHTVDDGRDIGIRFHYYKGIDDHAFLGWENSTQTLIYLQSSDEASSNITGTFGNVQFGSLLLSNTTAATSTTTGALQVSGGVGIGGNLNILNTGDVSANIGTLFLGNASTNANLGAFQTFSNSNAASQATSINTINANTGAYQTFANANVSSLQNQITGANTNIQTTSANLGAFQTYANTKIGTNTNSNLVVVSTTPSTSNVTGALVVAGGAGISGNVYSDKVYIDKGVFWSSNSNPYGQEDFLTTTELGSITDLNITSSYDFGLVNDSSISTFYDFGSLTVQGVIEGSQIVANSIPGSKLITGTDISIGNITVTGNVTTANILPSSNITFNLGSPDLRWKDIYLSGSSLYLDNVVLSANTIGSSLQVNGVDLATIDNYDLDDISGYADGFKQVFALTYNLANVSFGNPWQLSVAVNGIPLPAFNSNPNVSIVWQSFVFPANKGYTLVSNTSIKFVEAPAPRSDIYIRKQSGTTPSKLKLYPFKPIDILMASSG